MGYTPPASASSTEPQPITYQGPLYQGTLDTAARPASSISPKVSGGVAAGAVATIAVFVAQAFGLDVPAGVEGALAVLISAIAGYFIPDNH